MNNEYKISLVVKGVVDTFVSYGPTSEGVVVLVPCSALPKSFFENGDESAKRELYSGEFFEDEDERRIIDYKFLVAKTLEDYDNGIYETPVVKVDTKTDEIEIRI